MVVDDIALVGAGAVVTSEVSRGETVAGMPARPLLSGPSVSDPEFT